MRRLLCTFLFGAVVIAGVQARESFDLAGFEGKMSFSLVTYEEPFEVRSVQGIMTDQSGEPFQGALFEIKAPGKKEKFRRVRTDKDGKFKIEDVPDGRYQFLATMDGRFQGNGGTLIVTRHADAGKSLRIALEVAY